MKKIIKIEGMSCGHCQKAATKALSSIDGVSNVVVSLENKQASIEVNDSVNDDIIKETIDDAGYEVVSIINE